MSEEKHCPLFAMTGEGWTRCLKETCAWWVSKAGCCCMIFIAETAGQIRALRKLLVELVEIRELLELPA